MCKLYCKVAGWKDHHILVIKQIWFNKIILCLSGSYDICQQMHSIINENYCALQGDWCNIRVFLVNGNTFRWVITHPGDMREFHETFCQLYQ